MPPLSDRPWPTPGPLRRDAWILRGLLVLGALFSLASGAALLVLLHGSLPVWHDEGVGFLTGTVWDPVFGDFGALPFLVGTLITSILALLMALPFALGVGVALGEFHPTGRLSKFAIALVELAAGIPSVIYGFWALQVVVPLVRSLQRALDLPPMGLGILAASIVLAAMVMPYAATFARDALRGVPGGLREASLALGATRFEALRDVILPRALPGILAGITLSFGRALGETMAVTMVIGNAARIPGGLFDTGNTVASVIASEFAEAGDEVHMAALLGLAMLLFLVTAAIQLLGRRVIAQVVSP